MSSAKSRATRNDLIGEDVERIFDLNGAALANEVFGDGLIIGGRIGNCFNGRVSSVKLMQRCRRLSYSWLNDCGI